MVLEEGGLGEGNWAGSGAVGQRLGIVKGWGMRRQSWTSRMWGRLVQCGEPWEEERDGEGIGDCGVEAGCGRQAGGEGLGKVGTGKGGKLNLQGCLFWVKQLSTERAKRGASAGTECWGGAQEQEACGGSCGLSLLLWGWRADSSLPLFTLPSRRDAGPQVCHGPWCQAGGCPGLGGWVGGWFAPASLAGTAQSLGSQ